MTVDDLAIVTEGLTKRYGAGPPAVVDVNLAVRRGEVYGFVGRNGAGKTTTMRMLVGLVRPTSGTIALAGRRYDGRRAVARVGALIEAPRFYPHLSGADNLRLLCRYFRTPPDAVPAALDQVGLTGRGRSRFAAYSLGMKQRLGIAAALLGDPKILILDEPTNGLDPAGMADIRGMVRGLRADHRTVLLSSHLLSEVEQVCDRVGVLHDGRLVAQGSLAEIRDADTHLAVSVSDPTAAAVVVAALAGVTAVTARPGGLDVVAPPRLAAVVNQHLVLAGHDVSELRVTGRSLEEAFLGLTGAPAAPEGHPL